MAEKTPTYSVSVPAEDAAKQHENPYVVEPGAVATSPGNQTFNLGQGSRVRCRDANGLLREGTVAEFLAYARVLLNEGGVVDVPVQSLETLSEGRRPRAGRFKKRV